MKVKFEIPYLIDNLADIKNLKITQLADGTYATEIFLKDAKFVKANLLPENAIFENDKIIINNDENAIKLLIAWNDYKLEKQKTELYQAQINLIGDDTNVGEKTVSVRDFKLTALENKALTEIATILANKEPEIYLSARKKINYSRVFAFLIKSKLNDLAVNGNYEMLKVIADDLSDYVVSKTSDLITTNQQFLQKSDEMITRQLFTQAINNNIFKEIINALVNDNVLNVSPQTKATILNYLNTPFLNGVDIHKLSTGNENINEFVNNELKDLFSNELNTLKMKIVDAPVVKPENNLNSVVDEDDVDSEFSAELETPDDLVVDDDSTGGGAEIDYMDED